ncbi:MAG: hypothetical protein D6712_17865 [Chloroflexi bacterium]|nr:MAG: hypothetical protein D6712_17865 [Chloroflexota bacterium]
MASFGSDLLWGRSNTILNIFNGNGQLTYSYNLGIPDSIAKIGYEQVFGGTARVDFMSGERREGNSRGWRFVFEATWLNQDNLFVQRVLYAINYAATMTVMPHEDVNQEVEVIRPQSFLPQYAFGQFKALDLTLKFEGRYTVAAIPMGYIGG